ncbi:hypothetical protein HO913_11295, partial [Streptococcus suis]|nr:hypothetical protein [Streptococcus suis]
SMTNMKSVMESIDERLRTRIRVIIWKQWKKKSKRLWGLLKLGVPKWIADKVSGWGDHYQLVAQRSVQTEDKVLRIYFLRAFLRI